MTEWYGWERNGLSSLSLGGGMEQRLRGIVGGSLEQLSASLHYLPASRTNALPSSEARALLSSVGFNDAPPPDISALLRQPGYSDGNTAMDTATALSLSHTLKHTRGRARSLSLTHTHTLTLLTAEPARLQRW